MVVGSRLLQKIKAHNSALAMLAGATAFFFANYALSKVLNSFDYGVYSLIATVVTITTSFGLLGHEQSILRLSKVKGKYLEIPSKELFASIGLCLAAPAVGILYVAFAVKISTYSIMAAYVLVVMAVSATLYCYIDRARGEKLYSQLHSATWKISLLFGLFICVIYPAPTIQVLLVSSAIFHVVLTVLIVTAYSPMVSKGKISSDSQPYNSSLNVSFLVTMFTIAALSFGDRIFIQHNFGLEVLGKFFLYQNLLLSPLLILSNYLAINEVQKLKDGKRKREVVRTIFGQSVVAVLAFMIIAPVVIVLPEFEKEHMIACLVILAIGAIRIPYATISAIQSVFSSPRQHHIVNILSISPAVLFMLSVEVVSYSRQIILPLFYVSILAGWLLRVVYVLRKFNNSQEHK